MKKILLAFSIFVLLGAGCSSIQLKRSDNPVTTTGRSNFVPGEVEIQFNTTLSFNDINKFLQTFGLQQTPQARSKRAQTFLLNGKDNNASQVLETDIQQLENQGVVQKCSPVQNLGYMAGQYSANVSCSLSSNMNLQNISKAVSKYPSIFSVFSGMSINLLAYINVIVPNGQEDYWVNQLNQHPEVIKASRVENGILN